MLEIAFWLLIAAAIIIWVIVALRRSRAQAETIRITTPAPIHEYRAVPRHYAAGASHYASTRPSTVIIEDDVFTTSFSTDVIIEPAVIIEEPVMMTQDAAVIEESAPAFAGFQGGDTNGGGATSSWPDSSAADVNASSSDSYSSSDTYSSSSSDSYSSSDSSSSSDYSSSDSSSYSSDN